MRRRQRPSATSATPKQQQHASGINHEEGSSDRAIAPLFGSSGCILSRTSAKTLMTRRWQKTYWVHYLPATILVFRSREDFDTWTHKPSFDLKDRLVLTAIDFDTQGLQRRNKRSSKMRKISNTRVQSSKLVSRLEKYSLTEVHTKLYGHEVLHSFKVERWSDVGVTVAAAFASPEPMEVAQLRRAMYRCLNLTGSSSTRNRNTVNIPDNISDITGARTASLSEMASVAGRSLYSHRSDSCRSLHTTATHQLRRHQSHIVR